MNDMPRLPRQLPTTLAADGVPRYRWTLAQFERLSELGFFAEDDRIELIGGDLVPMASKGFRHERVRGILMNALMRRLPDQYCLFSENGWRPDGQQYFEPDMIIAPATALPPAISPAEVCLIVEVADSSLKFDSGLKALSYASLSIPEYWVVNAVTLTTRVFREPGQAGYGKTEDHSPETTLNPQLVPGLSIRLADLNLG